MDPKDLVPWFQIGSTVIAAFGIGISTFLGITSLNNNRRDREFRTKPELIFNEGGQLVKASVVPLDVIPGKAPNDPELVQYKRSVSATHLCLRFESSFGGLFNHGVGTAYNVCIWFEAERRVVDGQPESLRSKQADPPYSRSWNSITAEPNILASGKSASFRVAPACIFVEGLAASQVGGTMRLECTDVSGKVYRWSQPVTFFIDPPNGDYVEVTISFAPRVVLQARA